MDNKQVPTHKNLHALISQFGGDGKVPEEIVTQEVLRKTEAEKTS
jgi:hypothetical protein